MNRLEFNVRLAFTLAEVLITLGIIGIVAAMTIPTLMTNINQNVFNSAQDLAVKKMRAATDQMRTDDLIGAYDTNDHFVDQFQKYIKIVKRCDSSNLQECFSPTFKTDSNEDINVSDLTSGKKLGQGSNTSNTVGLMLINGTSMLLAYDPTCQSIAPSNNTIDTTACMAVAYDTNGFGKPNQIGKDIALLNATISSCDGKKIGGMCVAASDTTYTPYGTFWNGGAWDNNYWAGADKACTDLGMRLPDKTELNTIYINRATISGLSSTGSYWTSTPNGPSVMWSQNLNTGFQCTAILSGPYHARCVK